MHRHSYVPSRLEVKLFDGLRAPKAARESRCADGAALAWRRIASRPAVAADIVVALCIAEDISAGARLELRPAALESPRGGWRGCSGATTAGLCHARSEKESEEDKNNRKKLNSVQSHE
jgi:hypothetical protein